MRTGRPVAKIELSSEVAGILESYTQRRQTAQALALRARIVGCAVGLSNKSVAARERVQTVGKCRAASTGCSTNRGPARRGKSTMPRSRMSSCRRWRAGRPEPPPGAPAVWRGTVASRPRAWVASGGPSPISLPLFKPRMTTPSRSSGPRQPMPSSRQSRDVALRPWPYMPQFLQRISDSGHWHLVA